MSESIAHYDILGVIASGALGPIYRARDTKVGRTVAVRVISQGMSDPARRARVLDLVQPFTALTHPHVATLFEAGEQRGSVYLVYEFVPGDKLGTLIDGRPMNPRRVLDLTEQVADAIAEAHSLELVHGDLTPSTVVVTPKGHAKILNFGLMAGLGNDDGSAPADLPEQARQDARCAALGAPRVAYTAPEQLSGKAPDSRTDLFALGAILYEMLTGKPAFAGRTPAEIGARVVKSRPPIPSVLDPGLPGELDGIVGKALAKKPENRYQSAATFAAEIRAAAASTHSRRASQNEARSKAPAPRSPWRVVMLGALLLAAIAVSLWQWREPIRQAWQGRFGAQPEPLLVVLPFQVTDPERPRPYFGAGFAEDLARRLGHTPGITVLGRSSIRTAAGRSPQSIAAAVRANVAVAGTITPADDDWSTVKIETRLLDGRSGRVIWSSTYTSDGRDLIAFQARMTREIAARLRLVYTPTAGQGRSALRLVDPSAYNTYLKAREALASNDSSRAAQLFEDAADQDPSLVEARAGLALALHAASAFDGREHYGDAQPRARAAAEAAFATDPDIGLVRLAMGLTAPTWHEALDQLRRAVGLDTSYAEAYLALADVLRPLDPARATRFAQRAADLDPEQPLVHFQLAADNLSAGDLDGALLAAARGQALAPALPWWDAIRLRVRLARATAAGASPRAPVQDIRDAGDFPPGTILRALDLGAAHRAADALALLASLSRLHPGPCDARAASAAILFKIGRPAEALRFASEIASRAAGAPEGSGWARCSALAAAAVNDTQRASAALLRIAASEPELRAWSAVNPVLDGEAGLQQRVFPWSNVAADPAVVDALRRVDAALARARADAARILGGM